MAGIQQPNQGVISFKDFANAYDKTLDMLVVKQNNVPQEGAQFFRKESTNLETYKEAEMSPVLGLPVKSEDTDGLKYVSPVEGQSKTYTNIQYRLAVAVTRRAIRAQKNRVITQMVTGLPQTAQRKLELAYASIFDGGFATETTADSQYVWSTTHNHDDKEAGNWSNKAASGGGITTDTLNAAWLNFQTRENDKGFPDPRLPRYLVFPPQLNEAVRKILESTQYPQNALNANIPAFLKAFTPVMMHWLTSTTAWYVFDDSPESQRGFVHVTESAPEYQSLSFPDNPEIVWGRRLLMAFAVGATHARDSYGNAGA